MGKIDLKGKRFGRWLVVEESLKKTKSRYTYWVCQCDCGKIKDVVSSNLINGKTISCGCFKSEIITKRNTTHKKSKSSTYHIWSAMIQRCNNPKSKDYELYGGRGITVCDEWKDFSKFIKDMGERPLKTTIDRINVNLGYFKGNCRWASNQEQSLNKRTNRMITYNGRTQTLSEWAKELNINRNTIAFRLNSGWSVEKTIETTVN
jgi:hypothetical protein